MGAFKGFSSETGAAGGCPHFSRTTSHRPRGSVPEDQQPGTNIDISADRSSARMPTSIDTNAEPVLSLLYIFILFSSLLSIHGVPLSASPPAR
jgi:hypothetical protein